MARSVGVRRASQRPQPPAVASWRSEPGRIYTSDEVAGGLWLEGVTMPTPAKQEKYAAATGWTIFKYEPKDQRSRVYLANDHILVPIGVWLATGAPGDAPYPCRCEERWLSCTPECGARCKHLTCYPPFCPCNGRADTHNVTPKCCAHPRTVQARRTR